MIIRFACRWGARLGAFVLLTLVHCDQTDPRVDKPLAEPPCEDALLSVDRFGEGLRCASSRSCALSCGGCGETSVPYECPAMLPWKLLPRAAHCEEPTRIEAISGNCEPIAASGAAIEPPGPSASVAGRVQLPDGRWLELASRRRTLPTPGEPGHSRPSAVTSIPGSSLAAVVDSAPAHAKLFVVDHAKLATSDAGGVTSVELPDWVALSGHAAFVAPNRLYVAGGPDGVVYAFAVDVVTGEIARASADDIALDPPAEDGGAAYFAQDVAASADGKTLVVVPRAASKFAIVVDRIRKSQAPLNIGTEATSVVERDPLDALGERFWITAPVTGELLSINIATKAVEERAVVGPGASGLAVLPSGRVAVATSGDDSLAVYDSRSASVAQRVRVGHAKLAGANPTAVAYDGGSKRLFVALSGANVVAVYEVASSGPAAVLRDAGRLTTEWWPNSLAALPAGDLVVLTQRGIGAGSNANAQEAGPIAIARAARGSIAFVSRPTASDLEAGRAREASWHAPADGVPGVRCAADSAYDFPVPDGDRKRAEAAIDRVLVVLRGGSTYDSLFGALGRGRGDPSLVLGGSSGEIVRQNLRALADRFAIADQFFVPAEEDSVAKLHWLFGRSVDAAERSVLTASPRGPNATGGGSAPGVLAPLEGSILARAHQGGRAVSAYGEPIGASTGWLDVDYPSASTGPFVPDIERACVMAMHANVRCDLPALGVVSLPNDRTLGTESGAPTPEVMLAVSDEAVGMLVDAISHSADWPRTLIIIGSTSARLGADHLSAHRTPLLLVSPWVKRGAVTSLRMSPASMVRLASALLGLDPASSAVAEAPLPYDVFSGTPDFEPFVYRPREVETRCNP